MYQLCYISKSIIPEDQLLEEVDQILRFACEENPKLGVTGILIYRKGWFCQFIESDSEDNLTNLYGKICGDTRHQNISTIFNQVGYERVFGNWSMIFKKIEESEDNGFIERLKKYAQEEKVLDPKEIKAILRDFNFYKEKLLASA